jgi:hypothetical protein
MRTLRSLSSLLLALPWILLCSPIALAQVEDDIELKLFRPRLELGGDSFSDRAFEDGAGDYGSRSTRLDLSFPLSATHVRPQRSIMAYQLLGRVHGSSESPDITFLADDHRLVTAGVSVAALFVGSDENLYVGSVGATVAEDDETISDSPKARPYAFGLGTRHLGSKVTLGYGGAYSYQYGRGYLLPIIGVIWKMSPRWTLTALPPFVVSAGFKANEHLTVRIRTAPAGNRYRFSNADQVDFPGEPDTLYLRVVQWRTTGEVEWKASRNFSVLAAIGSSRTLRFAISADEQGDAPLFEDETKPAAYARVAARFTFGKTVLDEWNEQQP